MSDHASSQGGDSPPPTKEREQALPGRATKTTSSGRIDDSGGAATPKARPKSRLAKLVQEARAIEAEAAMEAGAIGYMARALVLATMPHRRREGPEFTRRNGKFTMSLLAPSHVGLPYGSVPRLLVAWVTTEAVRTRRRELVLGSTLSEFMRRMDLETNGGLTGRIRPLKEQMRRLFSSSVSCTYESDGKFAIETVNMVDSARLWWHPKSPEQACLWSSTLTLGERFFEEIVERPVPVDLRALRALRGSPLALDVYCWLTYRLSYTRKPLVVPWEALEAQFGSDYSETRYFRRNFAQRLKAVCSVYPDAQVSLRPAGLHLRPSRTHVAKR